MPLEQNFTCMAITFSICVGGHKMFRHMQALQVDVRYIYSPSVLKSHVPSLQLILCFIQLARYFCTGTVDEDVFLHYALNVPRYTHFTSPIRRYADLVVHRQLAAALGRNKPCLPLLYTRKAGIMYSCTWVVRIETYMHVYSI